MIYEGIIKNVIFTGDNNYAIISFTTKNHGTLIASGEIPFPMKGSRLKIEGNTYYNKKYESEQINIKSVELLGSSLIDLAVMKFISTFFKGFGEKSAQKFVMTLGNDLNDIFDNRENDLRKTFSTRMCDAAISSFEENKDFYNIYRLTNGEITENQAQKIIDKYQKRAVSMLKRNPYILTELDGIGFKKADVIATGIGIEKDSKERILAGIKYILQEAMSTQGHTYLLINELAERTTKLLFGLESLREIFYIDILKTSVPKDLSLWKDLEISTYDSVFIDKIAHNNVNLNKLKEKLSYEEYECLQIFITKEQQKRQNIITIIHENSLTTKPDSDLKKLIENNPTFISETVSNCEAIYISNAYFLERYVARELFKYTLQDPIFTITDKKIASVIAQIEKEDSERDHAKRQFNDDQKEAVKKALYNRISIITGGPGRGKTTILKAVCELWQGQVNLLAPTGKAANKMHKDTNREAMTIHRFIPPCDMSEIVPNSLVIIDETSMVDLKLVKSLLKKTEKAPVHIVFVGDKDQLPSIGVGMVLEDMIKSEILPCTYLTKCYRNDGSILHNIDLINDGGRLCDMQQDTHCRVLLDERALKPESIVRVYQKQCLKYGAENTVILTPMRENKMGVVNFNKLIQENINPSQNQSHEMKVVNYTLREGDRVINIKNDYKLKVKLPNGKNSTGVFNGETGVITSIEKYPYKKITVKFDDGKIGYYMEGDEKRKTSVFNLLELGYAMTIHKSQGSEYKGVILYMDNSNYILLNRKMLYTAASRAKDSLIMLGTPKAYHIAIQNMALEKRNSRLEYRLRLYGKSNIFNQNVA